MKRILAVIVCSLLGALFGAFLGSNLLSVVGLVVGSLVFGFWVGYIVLGASSDPEPEPKPWKGHDNYFFSLDPRAQAGKPSGYRTKTYKELGEEI
jgi:uncharacterized membrane protein YfcA